MCFAANLLHTDIGVCFIEFELHRALLLLRIGGVALDNLPVPVMAKQGRGQVKTMLGRIAMKRGRMLEARVLFRRAQALKLDSTKAFTHGSTTLSKTRHPEVLQDLEGLAQICMWVGEYREAKDLVQHALELTDNALATDNSRRSRTLLVLAEYMQQVGRYSEVSKVLQTLQASLRGYSERSPLGYEAMMQQAALDGELGFVPQANALLDGVEDLGILPVKHVHRAVLLYHRAHLHMVQYQFELARVVVDQAKDMLASSGLQADATHMRHRQARLARACEHVASKHGARPMMVKFLKTIVPLSWQLLDQQDALDPLRMRFTYLDAMVHVQQGHLSQARSILEQLTVGYTELNREAAMTTSHPLIGCCCSGLAHIAYAHGDFTAARHSFGMALKHKLDGGWLPGHLSMMSDHHGLALCNMQLAEYQEARQKLRLAKQLVHAATSQANTFASLAIRIDEAHLALHLGALRPDPRHAATTVDQVQKAAILKRVWFIKTFLQDDVVARERVLRQAAALCEVIVFKDGDVVAQPDEAHPFLLVMVSGSLDVLLPPRATSHPASHSQPEGEGEGQEVSDLDCWERVAVLRPGDTFGERCLLLASPFAVTLRAPPSKLQPTGMQEEHTADGGLGAEEQGEALLHQGEALLVPRHAFSLFLQSDSQVLSFLRCRAHPCCIPVSLPFFVTPYVGTYIRMAIINPYAYHVPVWLSSMRMPMDLELHAIS